MGTPARFAGLIGLAAGAACADPGAPSGPPDPPNRAAATAVSAYYPPPDASGGWRRLVGANTTPTTQQKADIRAIAGLDWDVLKQAWDASSQYGGSFLVIRHGYIAAEWGTTAALLAASCTKTITSLGVHRMFQLSADGAFGTTIGPEDFAYRYLPPSWGENATRRTIRLRHLLTMSSGLEPDDSPPSPGSGTAAYEQKLLAPPVRTTPGVEWSYASLPVDVLSLVTENVTGRTLGAFWQQQIGAAIGVASLKWGALGTHSYASAYASLTGRDMARIAYLLLQRGSWNGTQLVSGDRIDAMTQWDPTLAGTVYGPQIQFPTDPNTQERYGRLTWTNRTASAYVGAGVPADAYYCAGFRTNFFLVVPSLDLVIVRLQNGPTPWSDAVFSGINATVVSAVVSPANAAPSAAITSPAPGAAFAAPATITITADAADTDGSVTLVEFFANGAPVGSDATAPYETTWSSVAAGTYSLTARSTDDAGLMTVSEPVLVNVTGNTPPAVQITSPRTGASYRFGANINIWASASDADGGVARVEFFAGGQLLGSDRFSPYGYTWTGAAPGTYVLTARAIDTGGAVTTSAAVTIKVRKP